MKRASICLRVNDVPQPLTPRARRSWPHAPWFAEAGRSERLKDARTPNPIKGRDVATSGAGERDLHREGTEMLFVSRLEVREPIRVALAAEVFERVGRRDAAKLG